MPGDTVADIRLSGMLFLLASAYRYFYNTASFFLFQNWNQNGTFFRIHFAIAF